MNIYFACSITGGRRDETVYQQFVAALLAAGHEVPTQRLASPEAMADEASLGPQEIYRRDTAWIDGCDLLLAEVSTPSHGVGYEIAYALGQGKRAICMHRAGVKVSKMITGNPDTNLTIFAYATPDEAMLWLAKTLE